ncbi:hypothetical protein GWI34_11270 [Actinomadura sp. DSM 109109]|nr:hypothetical protein [Actinomadura lepetitiana]
MDLHAIEMVTDRLAAEFSVRPPKVTHGWVPRSMRLGVRAKIWRRRLRLVIGPASERLEPDELEGELASATAGFTLRRGFLARSFLSLGAVLACETVVLTLSADAPRWWQNLTFFVSAAIWFALFIAHYRAFIYRVDRRVVEVLGAGPLLAVLAAERRIPSNGPTYLWALPDADRRADRIGSTIIANG